MGRIEAFETEAALIDSIVEKKLKGWKRHR